MVAENILACMMAGAAMTVVCNMKEADMALASVVVASTKRVDKLEPKKSVAHSMMYCSMILASKNLICTAVYRNMEPEQGSGRRIF